MKVWLISLTTFVEICWISCYSITTELKCFLFSLHVLPQRGTLRSKTISGNWKPFKNHERCFLFHLKSSFCSWDISIFFWNFGHVGKLLDKKAKVNFKIYDVRNWKKSNFNTHSQDNRTMKYSQLMEHNIRKTIFEKSCAKCGWQTRPKLFF